MEKHIDTQLTEEQIIGRIVEGQKELYELIVRRYNPYLYKIGRSYNFNHDDTQDLMQDSFVDAYKNLIKFENKSTFKTWLARIMLNNCYHKKNKASFKNEHFQDLNDQTKPLYSDTQNNVEKMVHNHEVRHIIENALSNIPEDYRLVFSLREINGFNVLETAKLLEISEANVKVRLNRAKSMLRDEIQKTYNASDLYEFNLIYCDGIVNRVMDKIKNL